MLIDCTKPAFNQKFRLISGDCIVEGSISVIAEKQPDNVITGSGDAVYIYQNQECMEEYLSWYLSSHVGDLVTIRPVYRWSGTQVLDKPMWKWFVRLMNELEMKYVLMVDGREVPGLSAQPTNEELAGKGYLGRQNHERDGQQFYWGQRTITSLQQEQQEDLMHFAWQEDPDHTNYEESDAAYIYKGETLYKGSDRDLPLDNMLCREIVTKQLKAAITNGATRHTGPACVFKYMYEGGYTWLGAETMYLRLNDTPPILPSPILIFTCTSLLIYYNQRPYSMRL